MVPPRALPAVVLLVVAGCTGQVTGSSDDQVDPRPGGAIAGKGGAATASGGATASPAEPLAPSDVEAACGQDAPFPRRIVRLAPQELVTSLRAAFALDPAKLPTTLATTINTRGTDALVVSRDFLEDLNAVSHLIDVAALPRGSLGCDVALFGSDATCTKAFVTHLTGVLFRAARTDADVTALEHLARGVAQRSGGSRALEIVTRAMVMSPRFLYVTEGADAVSAAAPMNAPELAAFLSFRLTGGPPTDALLAALRERPSPASLSALIEAQFGREALDRFASAFVASWLDTGDIAGLERDARKHPRADAAFMRRLADETTSVIERSLAGSAGLDRLLSADVSSAVLEDDKNPLAATIGRPGIFTLPGIVAALSSKDHTNLPRRGRVLLRGLFCEEAPPPPPNATGTDLALRTGASEREKFEAVEKNPACKHCHVNIDRLAFPFEAYDELGQLRTKDEHGNAIDAASSFTPSGQPTITYQSVRELMTAVATHPAVESCVAIHAFRRIARRGERGAEDACLVRDLARTARAGGFRIADLVRDALVRTALAPRAD